MKMSMFKVANQIGKHLMFSCINLIDIQHISYLKWMEIGYSRNVYY